MSNWITIAFFAFSIGIYLFSSGYFHNPETFDIDTIEQLVFQKTNDYRQINGIQKLIWNKDLAKLARLHSEDMAEREFFSHDNPEGDGPTERAEKLGIRTVVSKGMWEYIGISENIMQVPIGNVEGCGYTTSSKDIANCGFDGWITSTGHRENIIDTSYSEIGVGVAKAEDNTFYLTQNFR